MKTAIITGASAGLGRELAKGINKYFPEIEEVWLVARRKDRLLKLSEEIDGLKCEAVDIDVTTGEGMALLTRLLEEKKPDVKLLINNAGCGTLGNFDGMEISGQLNMIDLNIRALTAVTRMALDHMSDGGNIINISSIASFTPNERMAVYCAGKAYVRSFSRALGMELRGRKIAVTVSCPGPMTTEFLDIAGISGNSKTFEMLPRVPAAKVAEGTLRAARRRRPIYTPGLFYKFYRVISAIVPDTIMMWFART
ncbi:MAG: SDR family NAD(P)-dependent oxidoreductase [Clostridia bacterium]|nr:SDR family NAD(P)-dependent oxidoreductase [Clostridia bacterium]